MKKYFAILAAVVLFACSTENKQENQTGQVNEAKPAVEKKQAKEESKPAELIIGERIDGPANIRDKANGKIILSLNDNVVVGCAPAENGWHQIGIYSEFSSGEVVDGFVKKGTKLKYDGKVIGEVLEEVELIMGEMRGYTFKDNIKKGSIIENVLADHLKTISADRTVNDLKYIIENFKMDNTDGHEGYKVYFDYESGLMDPSPMYRIGLVFEKGKLAAILHSRPLKIDGTKDHKLDRAFDCLVYNDIKDRKGIVEYFNKWVNSVD